MDRIVCRLWGFAFVTQHNSLETHPSCYICCLFLLLSSSSRYACSTVCLTIYLLKVVWVVSSFWLIGTKLLSTFTSRFFVKVSLYPSERHGRANTSPVAGACWLWKMLERYFLEWLFARPQARYDGLGFSTPLSALDASTVLCKPVSVVHTDSSG